MLAGSQLIILTCEWDFSFLPNFVKKGTDTRLQITVLLLGSFLPFFSHVALSLLLSGVFYLQFQRWNLAKK